MITVGRGSQAGVEFGMELTRDIPGVEESPLVETTALKRPWEGVDPTTTLGLPLISVLFCFVFRLGWS